MIVLQSGGLQIIVVPVTAGIDTRRVSGIFYGPAERFTYQCSGLRIQTVRTAVTARTAGKVREIRVKEGQAVKAKELLMELE